MNITKMKGRNEEPTWESDAGPGRLEASGIERSLRKTKPEVKSCCINMAEAFDG